MRIIVTGSSGQIGTNLGLRLIEAGHDVFGVDNRRNIWTDDFPYVIQDLALNYSSHTGGIGSTAYPAGDLVVHLAAHAKVHQLVQQPHKALENVIITYNVLEYCRRTKTPVIFASSREVYGDIHRFDTEETTADFAYTESTYSASKIAGEALIYSYHRCYDLPYIVFRFSNVYGRYDTDIGRMVRVIPLFIRRMSQGLPVTVYGRDKLLDFTFVDDCIDGIVRGIESITSGTVVNQTINLAYGEGNTLTRVAEIIAQEMDVQADIRYASPLVGEVTRYVANLGKAQALLGYTPRVPLHEGIKRAIEWQRQWVESRRDQLDASDFDVLPEDFDVAPISAG